MDIPKLIQTFKQKLTVQRYAYSTIKSYANCLGKFLRAFERYDLKSVKENNIENYMAHPQLLLGYKK